ncbi:hypothetical protein [Sulfitobacter sp. 20_GPM-1509m]|uniref:hypothetical protein n=1 Tax=Sulfitobacter sp. 20_GPM-1509m TaxID=1380367 RepID=UPI00048E7D52|nr:hypothetical protein [Sulfitobacter sp. 20_GPM-1509m]|tara:strand:+ start:1369 stop:1776 length:408 start_codon:yes stop_codon:yes gene_type:complete
MKSALIVAALPLALAACAGGSSLPKVEAPGLAKPYISLAFDFPAGSTCRVATSQGTLVQPQIPGSISFALSDKNAPASCTLPDGSVYVITAHNQALANTKVAAIGVLPDGRGSILTSTTDGQLLRKNLTGVARKR